jgi:hypothetical protein
MAWACLTLFFFLIFSASSLLIQGLKTACLFLLFSSCCMDTPDSIIPPNTRLFIRACSFDHVSTFYTTHISPPVTYCRVPCIVLVCEEARSRPCKIDWVEWQTSVSFQTAVMHHAHADLGSLSRKTVSSSACIPSTTTNPIKAKRGFEELLSLTRQNLRLFFFPCLFLSQN